MSYSVAGAADGLPVFLFLVRAKLLRREESMSVHSAPVPLLCFCEAWWRLERYRGHVEDERLRCQYVKALVLAARHGKMRVLACGEGRGGMGLWRFRV